ncbi:hypothetical protein EW145_g2463 [Phellinidium pouzarii]|uniref:DUF6534 domain-containing protein n=1 Tax=Phellinidium pouzarii TaxID=167371 RepID=A0A4S4LC95_9AGAM|nr:hypothetical protein EW145_g2463 [Phellinidium pouzarii]
MSTPAAPAVPVLPALDSTFGCLFLAGIFSTALWGAGSVQLYFYYDKYTKTDKWWLKIYIFMVYALDTLHQIFLLSSLYTYFVTNFANPAHLLLNERPLNSTAVVTALVDGFVQALFVMRVWHLSKKNYILTGILSLFVLGQTVSTMIYFGKAYNLNLIAELVSVLPEERAMDIIVTITDLSIASSMAYLLHSRRSGMRQTDTLINRLIFYTIATGLVSALAAVLALITAYVLPKTFIYLVFDLIAPKLYINSILALLNSRAKLRDGLISDSERGLSMNNMSRDGVTSSGKNNAFTTRTNVVNIKVDTQQTLTADLEAGEPKDPWERKRPELDDASVYNA